MANAVENFGRLDVLVNNAGFGHLSSIGGRIGTPGLGAYQASKWAVGGMSEVLAREVKSNTSASR